ncbi:hypothetical protein [Agromyces laixinhei]|uniref:hypothetical protein n=1 Tax=Agromyces laixinhei TaxID=2585717 RepID=UPI0012EEB641|nr:hypothetical protein [Agromyces laixinhei]
MSNLNASDAARYPTTIRPLSREIESDDDTAGKVSTLAADAGEATKHVADTAKGEAREVASEAGHQARKLLGQVGDELRGQAANQQTRAADALHNAGSSLSRMADSSDDDGYAPQLVRAAGDRIDSVANWLGTKDPGEVVEDVKRFGDGGPESSSRSQSEPVSSSGVSCYRSHRRQLVIRAVPRTRHPRGTRRPPRLTRRPCHRYARRSHRRPHPSVPRLVLRRPPERSGAIPTFRPSSVIQDD